ncbi:hypothetical protein [Burkholderia sp. BDU5]|uniref:hypothetical protein n=1 Tax=Burkholderia sp. BDU5 TaxID=1385590 RepID=UPI000ACF898D|nr:hypothetical protein [Burkholderia sp. BDU5]
MTERVAARRARPRSPLTRSESECLTPLRRNKRRARGRRCSMGSRIAHAVRPERRARRPPAARLERSRLSEGRDRRAERKKTKRQDFSRTGNAPAGDALVRA